MKKLLHTKRLFFIYFEFKNDDKLVNTVLNYDH